MYELQFLPGAERYFKKVKEKGLKAAFRKALETIQNDPYAGEAKVGDLAGVYGFDVFYREPLKTRLKIFHFPLIFSIIKL